MEQVKIVQAKPFFLENKEEKMIHLDAGDYKQRIAILVERMKEKGVSHVVLYGDREHFSNIEYFSSYDCRFEEGLYILDIQGNCHIVVGNEGYGYSYQIPYEIDRILYKNFSLQGQPRDNSPKLSEIFCEVGITKESKVGVVGYKYFYPEYYEQPKKHFDIPAYILQELEEVTPLDNIENFTHEITGLPNGIRMAIRTPKEIAVAEYSAVKSARVVGNLIKNVKVGSTELELSRKGDADFTPVCMFSLVNFGSTHLSLGLRSPDDSVLSIGEVCGLCYGTRGSLCSRTGVAAYEVGSYPQELSTTLDTFYKPFWRAIAAWYETVKVGVPAGKVYKAVMDLIGGEEFGVALNPGHNTGMDEWTNSPVFENSQIPIHNGTYMQCDIIASAVNPYHNAICEDTVIVADEALRAALKEEYPTVYERIVARQKMMREYLGIQIDDSLLPLSNLNGVYFPFLLDCNQIFAK